MATRRLRHNGNRQAIIDRMATQLIKGMPVSLTRGHNKALQYQPRIDLEFSIRETKWY